IKQALVAQVDARYTLYTTSLQSPQGGRPGSTGSGSGTPDMGAIRDTLGNQQERALIMKQDPALARRVSSGDLSALDEVDRQRVRRSGTGAGHEPDLRRQQGHQGGLRPGGQIRHEGHAGRQVGQPDGEPAARCVSRHASAGGDSGDEVTGSGYSAFTPASFTT